MKPTEGKLKKLYESLAKDGYELPADYVEFEKDMSDDNNLNSLYDNLVKDGYELPADKMIFKTDMFGDVKKKPDSQIGENTSGLSDAEITDAVSFAPEEGTPIEALPLMPVAQEDLDKGADVTGNAGLVEDPDFVGAVPDGYYASQSGQMVPVPVVQEQPVPFMESLKNTGENLGTRLQGAIPRLNIVAADLWENVLGKEIAEKWYALEGRDLEQVRSDAYKKLSVLEGQMKQTNGIVNSLKNGDAPALASAVVDAVGAIASTAIPAILTGGAGLYTETVGESIVQYNNAKAKQLGVSVDELYKSGGAELGVPAAIGTISGAMEGIGLKGISKAINAKIASKGIKAAAQLFNQVNKEGATEWVQVGLDEVNNAIGSGKSMGEAVELAAESMLSEKGVEAYAKGLVGASGAAAVGQAAKFTLEKPEEDGQGVFPENGVIAEDEKLKALEEKVSRNKQVARNSPNERNKILLQRAEDELATYRQEKFVNQKDALTPVRNEIIAEIQQAQEVALNSVEPEADLQVAKLKANLQNFDAEAEASRLQAAEVVEAGTTIELSVNPVVPGEPDTAGNTGTQPGVVEPAAEVPGVEESGEQVNEVELGYVKQKISALYNLAKTVKDKVVKETIRPVSESEAQALNKATGLTDIDSDYTHIIDNSAINHILKEHGDEVKEAASGQVAVNESDFTLIPEIIASPDKITYDGKNKKGLDVIIYSKKFPDNTTYYLEEVRTGRKELAANTMYKRKGSSGELMEEAPSSPTPLTPPDISNPDIIPQVTENSLVEENNLPGAIEQQQPAQSRPLNAGRVSFEYFDGVTRTGTIQSENPDGTVTIKGINGRSYPGVKPETVTPVSEIPPSAKPETDAFIAFTNKLKIDTSGTAQAFGLLPALYNSAIDVVQVSYLAGKKLTVAIQDAIDYIKANAPADAAFDEKGFTASVKTMYADAEKEARDAAKAGLADRMGLLEEKMFGSRTATDSDLEGKGNIVQRILGLPGVVQERTAGAATKAIGETIAKVSEKAAISQSALMRNVASGLGNIFKGFEVPDKRRIAAEEMNGIARNRAISDANKINKNLKAMLTDSSLSKEQQKAALRESLQRIDQVLDPEYYTQKTEPEFYKYLESEMGISNFAALTDVEKAELYQEHTGYLAGFTPAEFTDLTPNEQVVYETLREIYDLVHDMNFVIGRLPFNTYARRKGTYTARMYDVFELPSDIEPQISESRGKMNLGLYKQAGELDFWKLTNKVEDPVYMATKRLYQTIANKAIADYAGFIVNENPQLVATEERAGFVKLGDGYGVLSEKFVAQSVSEDFRGFFYLNDTAEKIYKGFKWYNNMGIRQFYKQAFTVYNPGVHLGNITGNNVFAFWLGIDPISLNLEAAKVMGEMKNYSPAYRYLLSKGVLGTDLTKGDLTQSLEDFNNSFDEAANSEKPWDKMKGLLKSNKVKDFYGKVDDVYKFAAFNVLVAQGIKPEIAVSRIKNGFQNSQRVAKAADFTSKIPVVGNPFFRFASDLERVMRNAITTRPLQLVGFAVLLRAVGDVAQYLSGESEEEREIRESRPGYPRLPLPKSLGGNIPLSFKFTPDKNESSQYVPGSEVNLARYISPLFTYTGINEYTDNSWTELLSRISPIPITDDYFSSDLEKSNSALSKALQDPVVAPIMQLALKSDFRGRNPLDPETRGFKKSNITDEEKLTNAVKFLSRNYGTPYMAFGQDLLAAANDLPDYYNRQRTLTQATVRFLGFKAEEFGAEQYEKVILNKIKAADYKLKDAIKAARSIQRDYQNEKIDRETAEKRIEPVINEIIESEEQIVSTREKVLRYIYKQEFKEIKQAAKN